MSALGGEQTGDGISLELAGHYHLRDVDRNGIDAFAAYLDGSIDSDPNIIRSEVQRGAGRPFFRAAARRFVHNDGALLQYPP